MAVIVKRKDEKYAVLGAGVKQDNFGASQEAYIITCDKNGEIEVFVDYADSVKVIEINGKTPEEILK